MSQHRGPLGRKQWLGGGQRGPGIAGDILFLDPGAVYEGALYL